MSPSKPAILCLHGGGTSAGIFAVQTQRLRRELSDYFDFVIIDAPFTSKPGPGVLPVFEGCGPFLRWNADESNPPVAPEESIEAVQRIIAAQAMTGNPFIGVMGFSQGCRMASGVLLSQRDQAFGLRFGIFLNPTWPAMLPESMQNLSSQKLQVPILAVFGSGDRYRSQGEKLVREICDPNRLATLTFKIGHAIPSNAQDTALLADGILSLQSSTQNGRITNISVQDPLSLGSGRIAMGVS